MEVDFLFFIFQERKRDFGKKHDAQSMKGRGCLGRGRDRLLLREK